VFGEGEEGRTSYIIIEWKAGATYPLLLFSSGEAKKSISVRNGSEMLLLNSCGSIPFEDKFLNTINL
jgi:hypothetical protein